MSGITSLSARANRPSPPKNSGIAIMRISGSSNCLCFLTDVDETMGPFTYVDDRAGGGEFGHVYPAIPPIGRYPEQDALSQLITGTPLPSVSCVGPGWKYHFADTSGLHRGGRSVTKPRIVLVGVYTSNAGWMPHAMPLRSPHEHLSPAAKFAPLFVTRHASVSNPTTEPEY